MMMEETLMEEMVVEEMTGVVWRWPAEGGSRQRGGDGAAGTRGKAVKQIRDDGDSGSGDT
jgi:hypothetical protein